jgi:hypothetical protein
MLIDLAFQIVKAKTFIASFLELDHVDHPSLPIALLLNIISLLARDEHIIDLLFDFNNQSFLACTESHGLRIYICIMPAGHLPSTNKAAKPHTLVFSTTHLLWKRSLYRWLVKLSTRLLVKVLDYYCCNYATITRLNDEIDRSGSEYILNIVIRFIILISN